MAILPVFSQLLRNLKFIFLGSHRNLFFEVISFFNLLHLKLLKCVKKNAILRKIFWYKVFSNEISSTQFPYRFHLNVFLWPITAKISLCKLDTKPPSNNWCCCLQFSLPSHSCKHNLCNKCGRSLKNKFRTSTGFLRNCINRGYNCKDHSSFDFISAVLMIYFIYICHKMETVTTM